jgi:hypothetical protein
MENCWRAASRSAIKSLNRCPLQLPANSRTGSRTCHREAVGFGAQKVLRGGSAELGGEVFIVDVPRYSQAQFGSPPAGNLCGLAGVFMVGALASAGAIVLIDSLILLLPRDR